MKITKYGHACLLIEEGEARFLLDPGVFSKGFEDLRDLSAILVTHSHPDHFVAENLVALVGQNPEAQLLVDEDTATELGAGLGLKPTVVQAGDAFEYAGVKVAVEGDHHAVIHPTMPAITNVGYRIAERFFYPGDNFTLPSRPVEVLALPLGAPWLKVGEVIDYVLAVAPKVAIPVHDAVLAMPGMHVGIVSGFTGDKGIEMRVVENGSSTQV